MFKKLLSIGAALIMGLCLFCGCDDKIDYLKEYDDGSNLVNVTAETEGTIYSLKDTYEMGFLSQRDLKKISYFHNADNEATFPVELFDPVEAAIKNTYVEEWNADESNSTKATSEDFIVVEFYGYYNKCCIVTVDNTLWNYPSYPTEEPNYYVEIGGVKFHVRSTFFPKVWIPNEYFYTLTDAYRYGWLTVEDAKSIAYYHNGGIEGNESVMSKNYTPKPKTPEVLDEKNDLAIRQDYFNKFFDKNNPDDLLLDETRYSYYGCYNNYAVVKIGCIGEGVEDVMWEENIGGVKIIYYDGGRLSVWKLNG